MDNENIASFVGGFFAAAIISMLLLFIFFAPISTEMTKEIVNNVRQSTNIVEALKKEHLVIRDVNYGTDADTVEIVVEYDFLYKNSERK